MLLRWLRLLLRRGRQRLRRRGLVGSPRVLPRVGPRPVRRGGAAPAAPAGGRGIRAPSPAAAAAPTAAATAVVVVVVVVVVVRVMRVMGVPAGRRRRRRRHHAPAVPRGGRVPVGGGGQHAAAPTDAAPPATVVGPGGREHPVLLLPGRLAIVQLPTAAPTARGAGEGRGGEVAPPVLWGAEARALPLGSPCEGLVLPLQGLGEEWVPLRQLPLHLFLFFWRRLTA